VQPSPAKQQLQAGARCSLPEDGQVIYATSEKQNCGHAFANVVSGLTLSRIAPTQENKNVN
jgi:hypothetical protein